MNNELTPTHTRTTFAGREFRVDPGVLKPQKTSLPFIDGVRYVLGFYKGEVLITDIGCGTGAIGVTLAMEFPQVWVSLTDINERAVINARDNAYRWLNDNRYAATKSDLLRYIIPTEIIVANLPFMPDDHQLPRGVELPRPAVFGGGADGMDTYERFWAQVTAAMARPRWIGVQCRPDQEEQMVTLANANAFMLAWSSGSDGDSNVHFFKNMQITTPMDKSMVERIMK